MDYIDYLIGRSNDHLSSHSKKVNIIMAAGFSASESEELLQFQSLQRTPRNVGLILGGITAYYVHRQKLLEHATRRNKRLTLMLGNRFNRTTALIGVAGIVYASADYLVSNKRIGANSMIGNLYNNNFFITSKEALLQNFSPFNRRFTEVEVEQFNENLLIRSRPDTLRKYIYNPYVHTEFKSEEEFNTFIQKYKQSNKVNPVNRPEWKQQMQLNEKAKLEEGEQIISEVMRLEDAIDTSGIKHGLRTNNWISMVNIL